MIKNSLLCCSLVSVFGLISAGYISGYNTLSNRDDEDNVRTEDCFYNLCNTTQGYPTTKILRILERNKTFLPLFEHALIVDVVRKRRISRSLPNKESEVMGCETVKSTYFPHFGRNVQDIWKTIVNVEQFKQEVIMETCQSDGKPCSSSSANGKCQQRFENKSFMTMGEKGTIQMDTFPIPSGCICNKI